MVETSKGPSSGFESDWLGPPTVRAICTFVYEAERDEFKDYEYGQAEPVRYKLILNRATLPAGDIAYNL